MLSNFSPLTRRKSLRNKWTYTSRRTHIKHPYICKNVTIGCAISNQEDETECKLGNHDWISNCLYYMDHSHITAPGYDLFIRDLIQILHWSCFSSSDQSCVFIWFLGYLSETISEILFIEKKVRVVNVLWMLHNVAKTGLGFLLTNTDFSTFVLHTWWYFEMF
jgi:hypothetical protein